MTLLTLLLAMVFEGQSQSVSERNALISEINQALIEQNQALAEQNQALAEQVQLFDSRVTALEESMAARPDGNGTEGEKSFLRFYLLWGLILLLVVVFFFYIWNFRKSVARISKVQEDFIRQFSAEKSRLTNTRDELDQKYGAKVRELHGELAALSLAITSLQKPAENTVSPSTVDEGGVVVPDGDTPFNDNDDLVKGSADDEKPKITSDECFFNLPAIFIRNEQRYIAVEGGVSITTANKWLDAWERNGWVERIARGKYMKTSKGKKITLHYLPQD